MHSTKIATTNKVSPYVGSNLVDKTAQEIADKFAKSKYDDCIKLFVQATGTNIPLSETVCKYYIQSCFKVKALHNGIALFNQKVSEKVIKSSEVCSGVVNELLKINQVDAAATCFEQAQQAGINFSSDLYNLLIQQLTQKNTQKSIEQAYALFQTAIAKKLKPSKEACKRIIRGMHHIKQDQVASKLYSECVNKKLIEVTPDLAVPIAYELFKEQSSAKVAANLVQPCLKYNLQDCQYNAIMDGYFKSGNHDVARKLFEQRSFSAKKLQAEAAMYDLHGLGHAAAFFCAENLCHQLQKGGSMTLISGKGLHSKNNPMFELRNLLSAHLTAYPDIICNVDPANEGRLTIRRRA